MLLAKNWRGNLSAHFMFSKVFENRTVYEIMWKNTVQADRPQMTTWRMRIACWISKATNTHSHYVIFIVFPLQQWLHEHTSLLQHTYVAAPLYVLCWSLRCLHADQILSSCRHWTWSGEICLWKKETYWNSECTEHLAPPRPDPPRPARPHTDGRGTQDAFITFPEPFRFAMESSSEIIRQSGVLVF